MGWRYSSWAILWVCVFVLALRVCAAGEAGGGPGDEVRLVPLKFQMQLPWSSGTHMLHPLTRSPKVEWPPKSLPVLVVPEGTINLATEVPVTASDKEPVIGQIEGVADGLWEIEGDMELPPGLQWVQIDLRASCLIHAIRVLHAIGPDIYYDVIIQISDDSTFERGVRTVFNNDDDGSSGRGKGTDRLYIESRFGKTIVVPGISGRYVRLYSNGNTRDDSNRYIEVEVYGVPTDAWRRQIAADRASWRTVRGLLERLRTRCPNSAVLYEGEKIVGLVGWLYCDEDFDAVAQLSTLRSLNIKGYGPPQRVTSAGAGRLRELKQLTKLEVERNRALLHVLHEHLPALQSIEELNLNFSAQPSDLPQITRLKNLRELNLWMCEMRDDDLAELARLEDLEELGLATNLLITDAGLVHLRKLTKLQHIDLRWTEVTPAGRKRLQQALPELRIEYEEPPAILRRGRE